MTTHASIGTGAGMLLGLLGLLAPAAAHAVGATPGVAVGGNGASWQGRTERFVTVPAGRSTLVAELRRPGGAVIRSRTIPGRFGIPLIAYDGSTEQLPATSPVMIVAERTRGMLPRHTSFVALSTRDLHVVRRIRLAGTFAFDALSPDGATMYLTRHGSRAHITRYTVRAYDIRAGRLLPGVIADRAEHEWRMEGVPATRLQSSDGAFAYTLYQGGEDGAFVHALDTRTRTARCIDIPGMANRDVMSMRLRLVDGGRRLVVVHGPRAVAAVDTRTLALVPARAHVVRTSARQQRAVPPPDGSPSSGSSTDAWAIGAVAVLLAGAGLVGLRRRMPHNAPHGGRS
jgi:hypothetical protein